MQLELPELTFTDVQKLTDIMAKNIASLPKIIQLNGEVGAGKTTFTAEFLKVLGNMQPFSSPTYTIVNVYDQINPKVAHFDLYRINEDDYDWIYEYLDDDSLKIIEWSSLHPELFEEYPSLALTLKYTDDEFTRNVTISCDNIEVLQTLKVGLNDEGIIFKEC